MKKPSLIRPVFPSGDDIHRLIEEIEDEYVRNPNPAEKTLSSATTLADINRLIKEKGALPKKKDIAVEVESKAATLTISLKGARGVSEESVIDLPSSVRVSKREVVVENGFAVYRFEFVTDAVPPGGLAKDEEE